MSLIGLIDNIPLYTTIEEAGVWGSQYGLEVVTSLATGDVEPGTTVTTGYHTHYIQGSQGFMAGDNHDIVMSAMASGVQNFLSAEQLNQGEFVVTTAERDAYASLVQEEVDASNAGGRGLLFVDKTELLRLNAVGDKKVRTQREAPGNIAVTSNMTSYSAPHPLPSMMPSMDSVPTRAPSPGVFSAVAPPAPPVLFSSLSSSSIFPITQVCIRSKGEFKETAIKGYVRMRNKTISKDDHYYEAYPRFTSCC